MRIGMFKARDTMSGSVKAALALAALLVAVLTLAGCGGGGLVSDEDAAARATTVLNAEGKTVTECWINPVTGALYMGRFICQKPNGETWCYLATDSEDNGMPLAFNTEGIEAERGCA
jgi:hypothetical protein